MFPYRDDNPTLATTVVTLLLITANVFVWLVVQGMGAEPNLSRSVCEGLTKEGIKGRTITVKLRLAPFRTRTRSQTLPHATHDPAEVVALARQLLERFELDGAVRLVGVGISSLEREAGGEAEQPAGELALPI